MTNLTETFRSALRVATPLLAIETADPALTIRALAALYHDEGRPIFLWNLASGFAPVNEPAKPFMNLCESPSLRVNPAEIAIDICPALPEGSIVFFMNAHRYIDNAPFAQAIWNLREIYKANRRCVVLLAPAIRLPAELANDVLVLSEPLPNEYEMARIIKSIHEDAGVPPPETDAMDAAVHAVSGLAAFPAEQAIAMSLTRKGLNIDSLWERKRQLIGQTKGLSVWREGQTFADIAGYSNIKGYFARLLAGKSPPRAVVFVDEIS